MVLQVYLQVTRQIYHHNLAEVIQATLKYIDNPDITVNQLMKYIKGPDFPTGGIIQGIDGIKKLMNQVKVEL